MRHLLLIVFATMFVTQSQSSVTWPGLWGPNRDGAVTNGVATPRGFKELWRRKSGGGYSEVIAGPSLLYTMEMRDRVDYVIALDPATGQERWNRRIGPTFDMPEGPPDGPTSTPSLSGDDLFVAGSSGVLVALDARTGAERWRADLVRQFNAKLPDYTFGSSPLVTSSRVIIQTGGEGSRGLIALDRANGRLVWSAPHTNTPSYASPILVTLAGVPQIVAASGDVIFAVNPADGRLLWRAPALAKADQNANSAIVTGPDTLVVSYWPESVMLKIARGADGTLTAAEQWRSPRFRGANGPIVQHGGNLYGFAGQFLLCADAVTGDVRWRERVGEGVLMRAGSNLFVLTQETGELRVVSLTPARYTEITRAKVLRPGATSVTGPSIAGRRMFLRNTEEIVAFEIQ